MITRMVKYTIACVGSFSSSLIGKLSSAGIVDVRRSRVPVDEHSATLLQKAEEIKEMSKGKALSDEINSLKASLSCLKKEYEESSLWGDCQWEKLREIEDSGYRINFHLLSKKEYGKLSVEEMPAMKVISDDGRHLRFVTVSKDTEESGICPGEISRPASMKDLRLRMDDVQAGISDKELELERLKESRPELERRYDGIMAELDSYLAVNASVLSRENIDNCGDLSNYLDIFEAFVPEAEEGKIAGMLDAPGIWFSSAKAEQDDTPVKLKNNRFIREFEVFTRMYGLPAYSEFDPTPILGPFFLLFFSICMGDAGYGILLAIIAFFLKKKMPESSLGKLSGLITILGAGTFIAGLFLGTFFGISLYDKAWVPSPLKQVMLVEGNTGKIAGFDPQIVFALAIGIFHICLAMVVKAVCFTTRTGFRNNLGTWGWTLLVVGGVATASLATGGLLGGEVLRIVIIVIAAISALGIFLFNNPKRHILKNVGAGLWDSYNMVTGLLGDTLSYLRLYALALAGGMLGGAFNNLGTMVLGDNQTWQWLPFLAIVIIGHALNLAMSCLGAFVHPLRLSFVEYFKNSGYEGKGVEYRPLKGTENETNENNQ